MIDEKANSKQIALIKKKMLPHLHVNRAERNSLLNYINSTSLENKNAPTATQMQVIWCHRNVPLETSVPDTLLPAEHAP